MENIKINCPQCGMPCEYSLANKYRPFCSQRCREIDLGNWASEKFAIADEGIEADNQTHSDTTH